MSPSGSGMKTASTAVSNGPTRDKVTNAQATSSSPAPRSRPQAALTGPGTLGGECSERIGRAQRLADPLIPVVVEVYILLVLPPPAEPTLLLLITVPETL